MQKWIGRTRGKLDGEDDTLSHGRISAFLNMYHQRRAVERTPAAFYVLGAFFSSNFFVLLYSPVPSFEGRAEVGDTESSPTLYCMAA